MHLLFDFIIWNVSPEIIDLGKFSLRWYGLLFATGFLIGQQILIRIYKQEGKSEKHVETLTVYMLIATVVGARLGHCLFYQPEYFLKHPIEILYIWEGGLASHGATIGILLAIYLYSRKQTDQSYLYVLDRLVITIALAGCLIRLGNLMNSEIYGKQTDLPFAFVYVHGAETELKENYNTYLSEVKIKSTGKDTSIAGRSYAILDLELIPRRANISKESLVSFVGIELNNHLHYGQNSDLKDNIMVPDGPPSFTLVPSDHTYAAHVKLFGVPRHPTQLYEAGLAFLLFLFLYYTYLKHKANTPEGRIFGLFVFILFSSRFLVEYLKVPQVDFENDMSLNMGQILSVPLIVAGLFILVKSYRKKGEIS
jgi:phosphatidylglycerol:prolipoprotein diacylglycerol transferase